LGRRVEMTKNNDLFHRIFFDDNQFSPIFSQNEIENYFDENIK